MTRNRETALRAASPRARAPRNKAVKSAPKRTAARMVRHMLLASTALVAAGFAQQAAAQSYTGQTVQLQYVFPDAGTLYGAPQSAVVGSGVEFAPIIEGLGRLDVSSSQLIFDFPGGVHWSGSADNLAISYNGLRLSKTGGWTITGFSLNPGLSNAGVNSSSFDADTVSLNWAGQIYSSTSRLVFDVTFALCPTLTTSDDTCVVDATTPVAGTWDALAGTDTLKLGGAADFSFDASTIGTNFLNFEQVRKTDAATVTLTGATTLPVYVDQGTLSVAGSVTSAGGTAVTLDGAGAALEVQSTGSVTGGGTSAAVYGSAANVGVTNAGTIDGSVGVYFDAAGSVTNQAGGLIGADYNPVVILGAGTVTNAGTIQSGTGDGTFNYPTVYLGGGGTVTNLAGGVIEGPLATAVYVTGGAGTVTNAGRISGGSLGAAVRLTAGGSVTNEAGGLIEAPVYAAIYISGGAGSVTNAGTINGGTSDTAVVLAQGGSVDNQAGGLIQGGYSGVYIHGGSGTVTNAGTIAGGSNGYGVYLENGGSVTNQAGGEISSGSYDGVVVTGGAGAVTNAGTIQGGPSGSGVVLAEGGTIDNQTGGVIAAGGGYGVRVLDGDATITSAGTITGGTAGGLLLGGAGTINLTLSAGSQTTGDVDSIGTGARNLTLAGALTGDYVGDSGADTLDLKSGSTTTGHISLAGGNDALSIEAGATLNGTASGDGGTDSLTLYGSGSASIDVGALTGFETRAKTGTGTWTLSGTDTDASGWTVSAGTLQGTTDSIKGNVVDNSTLVFHQAFAGTFAGNVSGTGQVLVNGGGSLTFSGALTDRYGLRVTDASAVTVDGSITSASGANAVWMDSPGASLTNTGAISGGYNGVVTFGGSVSNSGSITAAMVGMYAAQGGSITNQTGGGIQGQREGIYTQGAPASVSNDGTITGGSTFSGAWLSAGGSVDNTANGTISGGFRGVFVSGGAGVVTNAGMISGGTDYGVAMAAGGTVDNAEGGTISGGFRGVGVSGGAGVVTNAGTITGAVDNGVTLFTGGTVTNKATGVINAGWTTGGWGVWGGNAPIAVVNAGAITGEEGVVLTAGGSLDNQAGGIVSGRLVGVDGYLYSGLHNPLTITNAGTITGAVGVQVSNGQTTLTNDGTITGTGGTAINLLSAFNHTVNLNAGSITNGDVFTASGADAVTLAGALHGDLAVGDGDDAVTLVGGMTVDGLLDGGNGTDALTLTGIGNGTLDAGKIFNFESQTKIGTGTWTLSGAANSDLGWDIQGGVLQVSGGSALGQRAVVHVGADGTFEIVDSGATIGELTGDGAVKLNDQVLLTGFDDGDATFSGVISGTGALAKVGTGTFTLSGANTFTGTVDAAYGTLRLGADDVLADGSTVQVDAGATLDLQGFSDTVHGAMLAGTLDGTGTLTADEYDLNGATVNANLGTGALVNVGGVSTLNGTAAADPVLVVGGTLKLGASDRLADTATVQVDAGAVLDLQGFSDTVGSVLLQGTLNGTGTLTATEYDLNDATVNANLGAGDLFTLGGVSTLNGTAGADLVRVQLGTLKLGASNRLSDAAALQVDTYGTLDLQGFNDTVAWAGLSGTLNGTGTLTAAEYDLSGATVNANLGSGALFNVGGVSTLNGTAGAATVRVEAGTLKLGASERLSDLAAAQIDAGAALDLNGHNETLDRLFGAGAVHLGAGTLTVGAGGGSSGFGGAIDGGGGLTKTGGGTLLLSGANTFTGLTKVNGGELQLFGSLAGPASVNAGGTLSGYGSVGGTLSLNGGTVSPGINGVAPAAGPSPIYGQLTAGSFTSNGGTFAVQAGGRPTGWLSDRLNVTGAATLNGGAVSVALQGAASDYVFNQRYLVLSASSLTGRFDNPTGFVSSNLDPNLLQRLRYDVVSGGVVLEVRRLIDWSAGAGTSNQTAVGTALNGTQRDASDNWADTLNTLFGLNTADRNRALDTMSGEGVGDAPGAAFVAADRFASAMQGHAGGGAGAGEAPSAFAGLGLDLNSRRDGQLSDLLQGQDPLAAAERGSGPSAPGGWVEAYVLDTRLGGQAGVADAKTRGGGVATGWDVAFGAVRVGGALGYSQADADVGALATKDRGDFWHSGAYVGWTAGAWRFDASASHMVGSVHTSRAVVLGPVTLDAEGKTRSSVTTIAAQAARRWELGGETGLTAQAGVIGSDLHQKAFTEHGAGALSLAVDAVDRELYVGRLGLQLDRRFHRGSFTIQPYAGAGAAFAGGDREGLVSAAFSGAPSGTGGFTVRGADLPSNWAELRLGVEAQDGHGFAVKAGYDGALGDRLTESRFSVGLGWRW